MPSNLVCNSCKKTFIYPAKLETKTLPMVKIAYPFGCSTDEKTETHEPIIIEKSVCPHCYKPDIAVQEEPAEAQPTNVYVHDLVSGPNHDEDKLLAAGWKITARYAKQHHLEKYPIGESVLKKLGDVEQ